MSKTVSTALWVMFAIAVAALAIHYFEDWMASVQDFLNLSSKKLENY